MMEIAELQDHDDPFCTLYYVSAKHEEELIAILAEMKTTYTQCKL